MTEEGPLEPEILETWTVGSAPEGTEDRTWQRFVRRRRVKQMIGSAGGATAIAAAVAVAFVLPSSDRESESSGTRLAARRTTWRIGGRAVAVAEPGSELSWRSHRGATRVEQTAGNVFYRIDPGGPFEVVTTAGTVQAMGTCFRVEVGEMNMERRTLVTAGLASALTAAAVVTVYEGRAALSDGRTLGPGEATTMPGEPERGPRDSTAEAEREARLREQAATIRRLRLDLARRRQTEPDEPPLPPEVPSPSPTWTDDDLEPRFDAEARDEPWARAEEDRLSHRLVEYMNIPEEDVLVECRTSCCDVQLEPSAVADPGPLITELKSDIGVGMGAASAWNDLDIQPSAQSRDGLGHIYICQDPARRTAGAEVEPMPDRGLEREQLLDRAVPALRDCQARLSGALDVTMQITLDRHGAISDVETTAVPVGEPATRCVEQAILSRARFAPAPRPTWFPIHVSLDGPSAPPE